MFYARGASGSRFFGDGPVKVAEAVCFGLAGEVAQVGFKVFDYGGEGAESRILIVTVTDAEEIVACFAGGFGHRSISHGQPVFSPMLE